MRNLSFLLVILFFATSSPTLSQTMIGAQIDNRAGIKGLSLNPAHVVNPRLRSEIHLFSVSAYIGNDYIGLNVSDLNNIDNFQRFQQNTDIDAKPNNNFVGNLDVFGPGFQFNLDSKNSFALTTRLRSFFNLNNIGGEFLESIVGEEETNSFEVIMQDLSGIFHTWGEVSLTYGRVFMENEKYTFKGAASLKYLAGAGGAVGSSELLGAIYLESPNTLTTRGILNYGYSSQFNSDNINFGSIESGFAADLGIIYEVKDQSNRGYTDGYKLKLGLSLLDLGGINYPDFESWDYDMNSTISLEEADFDNFQDFLEANYNGTRTDQSIRFGMPTSLQVFGDYALTNRFYLSAHGSLSLRNGNESPVNQIINSFVLTPRMETGWFSLYSPISYRQFEGSISWGLGVRLGPVTLGSGSILTNLLSKNSRSTDAYFGLQIPIYKKGVKANSTL